MHSYSVLMSVYYKEKAPHLKTAIESIWSQSVPTDDFVLVCDGPLSVELNNVIEEMEREHAETFHVIRLGQNRGLGNALNIGLRECRNELVARMDSDDISRPDRCKWQLDVFDNNPAIGICSGIVGEFTTSEKKIEAWRIPPEKQEDILHFAKSRNPFNHPCVMYKKSEVEAAGSYQDFYLLEDYYLWIRMLQNGSVGYNIQKPLLWMRAGSELYLRRAGRKYAISQRELFRYMKDSGFISHSQYVKSLIIRSISSFTPNWLREFLFKSVMRKKQEQEN